VSKHLHSDSDIFFFDRPNGLPEQGWAISDMSHTHNTFPCDILINRLRQHGLDEITISWVHNQLKTVQGLGINWFAKTGGNFKRELSST